MAILVTCGTGTVGGAVVRGLSARGQHVRLLSRAPEKLNSLPTGVKAVQGDLAGLGGNAGLFHDVDKMVLITPLSQTETEDATSAVNAAAKAGIRHIVFMSVHRAEEAPQIPHFKSKIEIQKAIQRSGVAFTAVKPNNFFQNDLPFQQAIVEAGVYPQPLGAVGCNRVDVRDIADAIVNAVVLPGHEGNSYSLVGPDLLNGEQTARTYSKYLKREIRYIGDDLESWSAQARQMLPDWMVKDLKVMYSHFHQKGLVASPQELSDQAKILGRAPRRFDSFVEETVRGWTSKGMSAGR